MNKGKWGNCRNSGKVDGTAGMQGSEWDHYGKECHFAIPSPRVSRRSCSHQTSLRAYQIISIASGGIRAKFQSSDEDHIAYHVVYYKIKSGDDPTTQASTSTCFLLSTTFLPTPTKI